MKPPKTFFNKQAKRQIEKDRRNIGATKKQKNKKNTFVDEFFTMTYINDSSDSNIDLWDEIFKDSKLKSEEEKRNFEKKFKIWYEGKKNWNK